MATSNPAITRELANQLALRQRTAWCCSVAQGVMKSYSDYYRRTYKIDEALRLAWDFASRTANDANTRAALQEQIGELSERGDKEGYGFPVVLIGSNILEEIRQNDGKAAYAAVDDSASAFANLQLYRHNLSPGAQGVRGQYRDYIEASAKIVIDFALRAYQYYRDLPENLISRQTAYSEELKAPPFPFKGVVPGAGEGFPKAPINEVTPERRT